MKAFEDWWNKNGNSLECIDSPAHYDAKVTGEIVWKSALEWVLTRTKDVKTYSLKFINEELSNE